MKPEEDVAVSSENYGKNQLKNIFKKYNVEFCFETNTTIERQRPYHSSRIESSLQSQM